MKSTKEINEIAKKIRDLSNDHSEQIDLLERQMSQVDKKEQVRRYEVQFVQSGHSSKYIKLEFPFAQQVEVIMIRQTKERIKTLEAEVRSLRDLLLEL